MTLNNNITKLTSLILSESTDDTFLKSETSKNIEYYKKNYIFSLLSSMKSSYQCVYLVLGEDNFSYFSYQYIKVTKSRQPNIDIYGDQFASFLIEDKVLENNILISHLASIDWLLHCEDTNLYIKVPKGILQVWKNIIYEQEVETSIIDESQQCIVKLKLDIDNELYLQEE